MRDKNEEQKMTRNVFDIKSSSLSETIMFLRKQRNMTRRELAGFLSVSETTVSNYEKGKTRPDIEKLTEIAAVFGVSINILLKGYENKKESLFKDI